MKHQWISYYFSNTATSLNIHQKIIIAIATMIFMVSTYELLFHLLLETVDVLFESIEYLFDLMIEHLLETGTHETQVIVFYILVPLLGLGLYRLYTLVPRLLNKLKQSWQRQKNNIQSQWQALPMLQKIAWWSFFVAVINGWIFLT
jgi:hypothetical protein